MPAWITSLLREEVSVPIASAASSTITSRPACASAARHGEPDDPGADHDALDLVHPILPCRRAGGCSAGAGRGSRPAHNPLATSPA